MILRFVPYMALMSAVLPLTLAAAVGAEWTMVIWTAALFAIVEPLMGQVIEPFTATAPDYLLLPLSLRGLLDLAVGTFGSLAFYTTYTLCCRIGPPC